MAPRHQGESRFLRHPSVPLPEHRDIQQPAVPIPGKGEEGSGKQASLSRKEVGTWAFGLIEPEVSQAPRRLWSRPRPDPSPVNAEVFTIILPKSTFLIDLA